MSRTNIVGVLIAAGRGRRMGQVKQLVPWQHHGGTQPLVAAAFDAVAAVCDQMLVVLDTAADQVAAALTPREFEVVRGDGSGDMFQSVVVGLQMAAERFPGSTVLLQLGDHPEVRPETLVVLIAHADASPNRVIVPEIDGKGGHPILIPFGLIRTIVESKPSQGLKQVWSQSPDLCCRVAVDDPGVALDIDTPDQLS